MSLTLFTRVLGPEEFGIIALAMVYAVFIGGLANFGMTAAFDRNFFKCREENIPPATLLYTCLAFVIFNFIWLGLLTYLLRTPIARFLTGTPTAGPVIVAALGGQMFSSLIVYYLSYFKNNAEASIYTKYTIANTLLNLATGVVLVVYLRMGAIGIFYAQMATAAAIFLLLTARFIVTHPVTFSRPLFKASLRIAYPLTPRIFFEVIGTQLDKYMLSLLATLGNVGIYDIGQKIARAVFTFLTAIQNTYSPQVYRQMFENKVDGGIAIGRYLTPFAYLSFAVALLAALLSEEIIMYLTPAPFHGATSIIAILAVYFGTMFFGKINGNQLIYTKKTHISSALTALGIVLNIALNIPFIYLWGAVGAAWATMLAGLISGLISHITAQHYYRIHWETRRILGMLAILAGAGFGLAALYELDFNYRYRLFVKLAAMGAYLTLGIKIGILNRENLAMFWRSVGRSGVQQQET